MLLCDWLERVEVTYHWSVTAGTAGTRWGSEGGDGQGCMIVLIIWQFILAASINLG